MPELFITVDQDAFLEELRAEIADDVVGQYGRVRKQDALQYLIDNSLEGVDLDVDPESVDYDPDEVEEHVDDGPTAEATDGGAVTEPPAGGVATEPESPDAESGADVAGGDAAEAGSDAPEAGSGGAAGASDANTGGDQADGSGGSAGGGPTPSGGDDMMNAMMNLLDEHDEKWGRADTAETKYEVELPDGDTETVQTKDDVKAVLFKNY